MKRLFGVVGWALRILLAVLVLLFSLATFMGGAYVQTAVLWLAVVFLFWWPRFLRFRRHGGWSSLLRPGVILVLLAANFVVFAPGPKTSIYLSAGHKARLLQVYERHLAAWPTDTESIFLNTEWGRVHVLACGDPGNPPLVMIHAASMGAHSWADNLPPLLPRFRVYAIDNIGEGNRSELTDAAVFPADGRAVAELYAGLFDKLGIAAAPVLGASNGGFIAQNLALYHPDKVKCLVLFGPMGLTPLTGRSIMMLSIATMYPFQFVRDRVTRWALGSDPYTREQFADWFDAILRGTMPSVARPVPMTAAQKRSMTLPVLLFLGTRDPIVGDAAAAAQTAREYPDIEMVTLNSGHLVAVERREEVNAKMLKFLENHDCLPATEPGEPLE